MIIIIIDKNEPLLYNCHVKREQGGLIIMTKKRMLSLCLSLVLIVSMIAPTVNVWAVDTKKSGNVRLEDGTYTIDFSIWKESEDSASSAGNYFEKTEAQLNVQDGIAKLRLVYENSMIGGLKQITEDTETALEVKYIDNKKYVEMTFHDLSEVGILYMEIDTNSPFGVMKHKVRVVLQEDSLKQDGTKVEQLPEKTFDVADGTYTISLDILKETSDSQSSAGNYFKKENATLRVADGVGYLRLEYSNSMIGNLQQVIKDEYHVLSVTEQEGIKYVDIKLSSLEEIGYLYMEINTGTIYGIMKHIVRIVVDRDSLKQNGEAVAPEATPTPEETPEVTPPSDSGTTNTPVSLANGTYEVNIDLWHATNDQASMASSAVEGIARMVVKNKTITMYIYTHEMNLGTIKAHLQELKVLTKENTYKEATVEARDKNGNPICFSFSVPYQNEFLNVLVNPHVAMMGNRDIEARLKIAFDSIKKVNGVVDLTKSPSITQEDTNNNGSNVTPTPKPTVKPTTKPTVSPTTKPTVKPTTKPVTETVTATKKPSTVVVDNTVEESLTEEENLTVEENLTIEESLTVEEEDVIQEDTTEQQDPEQEEEQEVTGEEVSEEAQDSIAPAKEESNKGMKTVMIALAVISGSVFLVTLIFYVKTLLKKKER